MIAKLLIDECLSPSLVIRAQAAGHVESSCVRNRGWVGVQDWDLVHRVVAEDFTLVTHNARDFRGAQPGAEGGLYATQPIHAGLICLSSAEGPMNLQRQQELFDIALQELTQIQDLVNMCLEIVEAEDGSMTVLSYALPS